MRIYMSMLSALKCVMNGRALAPPAILCSVGVSTSVYPCASKKLRIVRKMVARLRKVSLTPSFTIKST